MEIDEIRDVIFDQIRNLKRVNIKPVCMVVSRDVMYELENNYYNSGIYPYSPYFSKVGIEEAKATFAGIPIGVIEVCDGVKGYIQVGGMV